MSAGSRTKTLAARRVSSAGRPIGTTRTSPARSRPGGSRRPRLSPSNVAVSVAPTTAPGAWPVSAHTPEGRSSATTGRPLSLIRAIASATRPAGAPLAPVPSRASTASAQEAPSACLSPAIPPESVTSTGRSRAATRRASFDAASPPTSAARPIRNTRTRAPPPASRRATTNPSPPLLPLPHTTTMPRPRSGRLRAARKDRISAAAPCPAFSMSVEPAMPSSAIARRSRARISAAVKTGFRACPGRGSRAAAER